MSLSLGPVLFSELWAASMDNSHSSCMLGFPPFPGTCQQTLYLLSKFSRGNFHFFALQEAVLSSSVIFLNCFLSEYILTLLFLQVPLFPSPPRLNTILSCVINFDLPTQVYYLEKFKKFGNFRYIFNDQEIFRYCLDFTF